MRLLRIFLADRWSGGVLATLTAALVVLQVLAAAYACAATMRAGPANDLVICHGDGTAGMPAPSPGKGPFDAEHGCPFGTLCGAGLAFAARIPALGGTYALRGGVDVVFAGDPASQSAVRPPGAPPFPTGPPALSA